MGKDSRISALRGCDFFESLRDKELAEVARMFDRVSFPAGTDLLRQGANAYEAYVVDRGTVAVVIDGERVATVGAGEVLGEIAVLDHGRRSASAIADTPVEAFVIERRAFVALLETHPALGRRVSSGLSQRLRRADRVSVRA